MSTVNALVKVILAGLVFGVGMPVLYVLSLQLWDRSDRVDNVIARRGTLAAAAAGFTAIALVVLIGILWITRKTISHYLGITVF